MFVCLLPINSALLQSAPRYDTYSESNPFIIDNSFGTYFIRINCVEKFHFDASYKTKCPISNRKLVQFTFSHAIKADKKRKLKLKISNA